MIALSQIRCMAFDSAIFVKSITVDLRPVDYSLCII